jgi:hypothetical protein
MTNLGMNPLTPFRDHWIQRERPHL